MMQRSFAEKLRVLRAQRGLPLTVAADRIGIDRHTLRNLERGETEPRYPTLEKISGAYGVPVEDLLEEEPSVPLVDAPSEGPLESSAAFALWGRYVHRVIERWEEKLKSGQFEDAEIEEFAADLEDISAFLVEVGLEEKRQEGPDLYPHNTYGHTTTEAIRRLNAAAEEGARRAEGGERLRRLADEMGSIAG